MKISKENFLAVKNGERIIVSHKCRLKPYKLSFKKEKILAMCVDCYNVFGGSESIFELKK